MSETQKFLPLGADESLWIAQMLELADLLARRFAGRGLAGGLEDLETIGFVLARGRSGLNEPEKLDALGYAFGEVLLSEFDGFGWCIVEDEFGRDACLRYLQTSLILSPVTMVSRRFEKGEQIDLPKLFAQLDAEVARIVRSGVD